MMPIDFYFGNWIRGWIQLFSAIVTILTFGFYRPWWDFSFLSWYSRYHLKNNKTKILPNTINKIKKLFNEE